MKIGRAIINGIQNRPCRKMDISRRISNLPLVGDLAFLFWFFYGVFTDDKAGWWERRRIINECRGQNWVRKTSTFICNLGLFVQSFFKGLGWLAEFGLKPPTKEAKPVIRETATLFSIVITAGALLVIGQIDTNRPIFPFIAAFSL